MTDLELFKQMLTRKGTPKVRHANLDAVYLQEDWGSNIAITFAIEPGISGSDYSLCSAHFDKLTGNFTGFMHCD